MKKRGVNYGDDGDTRSKGKNIDKTTDQGEPTDKTDDDDSLFVDDFEMENEECEEEHFFEEKKKSPRLPVEAFYAQYDSGAIDLAFSEHLEYENSPECYPKSYYTLTGKERLLLLYAENFRKQYSNLHPNTRPLVLAIKNECQVQKLVCTTIRPCAFPFPSLIRDLEGCASFVADFIEYRPLENLYSLPKELVSPPTLVRRRYGNSFEMATFLCCLLIGAGYPAMVVSGSARMETVQNDQSNVEYEGIPEDQDYTYDKEDVEDMDEGLKDEKYKLRPKPVLESDLAQKMAEMKRKQKMLEKAREEEEARLAREALIEEKIFRDPKRLSHAWVVVVHNAPWTIKPKLKLLDENGEEYDGPVSIEFIEPTTGCKHKPDTSAYVHVESVWNNMNYYVNLQEGRICDMKWDFGDTSLWEHFLPGEPPEMRIVEQLSDENLMEETVKESVEKHLDITRTWVGNVEVDDKVFDERYPNRRKTIHYKRVLYERFSSHSQSDGKIKRLTVFTDIKYQEPEMRWTWYENRSDLMTKSKVNFITQQVEEEFMKGRSDCLKYYIYNEKPGKDKILHFYSIPRPDSLRYCMFKEWRIILHFEKIPGKCFFKQFSTKYERKKLSEIIEKFQRDESKPAHKDIAEQIFLLDKNQIHLKFHYVRGALTAWTRVFTKPPKPDYGEEIKFDPNLTKGIKYGSTEAEPTQLELYILLLKELKAENAAKKAYEKHTEEIQNIIEMRNSERSNVILTFKAFDPLRNTAARRIRIEEDEEEKRILMERAMNEPDFLAPYLVPYAGRSLTQKESWEAYYACLNEMKTRFVSLLNELQRRYEDLTAEALSLKKFLLKFENKFDDFDYERLLEESKSLELNKRMVQKRLTITHEEAQKKYDAVKQSLLVDPRLNLK